jgi:hypothetical protein
MFIFAPLNFVLCGLGNRMVEWAVVGLLIAYASLMPRAAGGGYSNAVDIFDVVSGAWSTAALSVARQYLAATSLSDLGVAIFAGGQGTCCDIYFRTFWFFLLCGLGNRMLELAGVALLIACASLMPCAVDGGSRPSNAVDIFNVVSGAWSTAALSVARHGLAATSLSNLGLAIFAGGLGTCSHVCFSVFVCCVVLVGESDA